MKETGSPDLEFEVIGKRSPVLPPFKEQIRQLLSVEPYPDFTAIHDLLTLSPRMFLEFLVGWTETEDA